MVTSGSINIDTQFDVIEATDGKCDACVLSSLLSQPPLRPKFELYTRHPYARCCLQIQTIN